MKAPAVITSSAYKAVVEKELAKVRVELKVSVPGKPWAELPIAFGDAAIASLEGADENILLRGEGNGAYKLLIGKSGEHTVVLNLVARVRTLPDGKQLAMTVPPVAVTRSQVKVPLGMGSLQPLPNQGDKVRPSYPVFVDPIGWEANYKANAIPRMLWVGYPLTGNPLPQLGGVNKVGLIP